jgi:glutamine amidotransferase-like uncharacterized protein
VNKLHHGLTRSALAGLSLLILLFSLGGSAQAVTPASFETADLAGVKVAIYGGGTSEGHNSSTKALIEMFGWMNASVQVVVGDDVCNGVLDDVDIFAVPGASPYTLMPDLGLEGRQILEDFIRNGGSYFGICGGTYYEWDVYLHYNDFLLFNGELNTPLDEVGYGQNIVNVSINHEFFDIAQDDTYSVSYWDSGYFSDFNETVRVIANYTGTDLPAMIAYEAWNGSVFLSSVLPEFEENDNRDNTDFLDTFDDPESEWGLMLSVSNWLIENSIIPSPTTDTTTTTSSEIAEFSDEAILVITIGISLVIIALVFRRFRRR